MSIGVAQEEGQILDEPIPQIVFRGFMSIGVAQYLVGNNR